MYLYRSHNNGEDHVNNGFLNDLILIPSMFAWPVTLPVILGLQFHYYPKQTELNDLEYWCSRIKKGQTGSDKILSLEYKYLSRDFVIDKLKKAFAENDAIKKLAFVKNENIAHGEIYRILRYNMSVKEICIRECKVTKKLAQYRLTGKVSIGVYSRSYEIESEGYFFNRDSDEFVVRAFLDNLERYSKGWDLGTKYLADKHFERAASFLQRLRAENIKTKRDLISKVEQQLGLWLGNNGYLIELQSPNGCSVKLDKHERNIITRDYGDYFHLLADLESDLKLNFFLELYISQLKGEIKLQKLDVEAIHTYCEIPEQKQKLDAAFEKALAKNKDVLEAFKANQYLFTTNFVPYLLAYMIAPTSLFTINPQTKTEQNIENIKHHLPYLALGIATAVTLALNGNVLALFFVASPPAVVGEIIHGLQEFVHLVKAVIHGKDLLWHDHISKLSQGWKCFFGVEADTSDQINFFNQSTCKSMKDPKEIYDFSGYLLENLSKVIPFSALNYVQDNYHTHIKDIRTLVAFFLCMSCLKYGYLPKGNNTVQEDQDLVNKMMFAVNYLGPSVQEIKSRLEGDTSLAVPPKLRRGLIEAKYKNEQGEWIEIQWSWDADMKVSVEPFNRRDAVTLLFEEKEDVMLTRRAMPFEISLLKSMLSEKNMVEPIRLPILSGVEFMEAKLPYISTDSSFSINSSMIAMEDLRKNMHTLEGIKDYQEYKTTQRKFQEYDQRIETLELDRELDRKEIAELKKSLSNLLNPQNDQGRIIEEKDTQIKELEQKNKKLENKLQEQGRLLHPSLRLERRSKNVDLLRTNQSRIFKQRILQDEKFDDVDSGNNSQLKI